MGGSKTGAKGLKSEERLPQRMRILTQITAMRTIEVAYEHLRLFEAPVCCLVHKVVVDGSVWPRSRDGRKGKVRKPAHRIVSSKVGDEIAQYFFKRKCRFGMGWVTSKSPEHTFLLPRQVTFDGSNSQKVTDADVLGHDVATPYRSRWMRASHWMS